MEIWHELVGKRVRLVGLQRAELNGSLGTVSIYNSTTKRLAVSLDSGKCLAIKPENLEELQTPGNATMDASEPPQSAHVHVM